MRKEEGMQGGPENVWGTRGRGSKKPIWLMDEENLTDMPVLDDAMFAQIGFGCWPSTTTQGAIRLLLEMTRIGVVLGSSLIGFMLILLD